MNEHSGEGRRRGSLGRGEKPGGASPDRESEERLVETERRAEQLREAWRRRRTAPDRDRPGNTRGGPKHST
ncbi:hypothetical protein GBA65_17745 [Rubrobacter marinus]|uniref:Uncharacterized protein n=1 Tax=Rubrobacter marinus TaxID=2653852 RepID=A0A6G8Q0U4_9ACTN|nr:hypothetical protein [Rubrobacter marinus]QIN80058.1 hypothetical protein GBA65_17745 [Rubrobacter marinus]